MTRVVAAVRRDGTDVQVHIFAFDVLDKKFDIGKAIRRATAEWCNTPEGREVYEANCREFNWIDFIQHVPNEFCRRFGFGKIQDPAYTIVDADEELVDPCDTPDYEG